MMFRWWIVSFFAAATALSVNELFPFGSTQDENIPSDVDDVSSPEIQLTVPIVFYEQSHESIFVNDNGILSFLTEVPSFFSAQFPLSYPVIAPLYSDVDTRGAGRVYYRETKSDELINRANHLIRQHFSAAGNFHAESLFIATWDGVGHYNSKFSLVNTYQVVIATDGEDSFVILFYPDGGVQWTQGDGKNPNLPDARAQAGFMSGDGRLFTLRGSGTDQTKNLDRMSNILQPGVWLFRVGKTGSRGNVMPADTNVTPHRGQEETQSCASAAVPCPPTSNCVDYDQGFCCVCQERFIGNGKNCMEKDKHHRINGKVNGIVNDIRMDNVDLHAYIVTPDGRTYTAISRIASSIGYDMQALLTMGGVIGWLFALPRGGAKNGFMITGGVFNRSVEVDFPQSGHHVLIQEDFQGLDVFSQMRVNIQVRGTLPSIPYATKIEVQDFEEEYSRASPGVIQSTSSKSYRLEGNSLDIPFVLRQTIMFGECEYEPLDTEPTRLAVARNFITYDSTEEILRFASNNKISTLTNDNPCREGRNQCGENSKCVVEGDTFRCVCDRGYEYLYEEDANGQEKAICVDINECIVGKDNCHIFAECINLPGSFGCRCQAGFSGNGVHCQKTRTCSDLNCDPNAECFESPTPNCRCKPDYYGDGYVCHQSNSEDCRDVDICDQNAECLYNQTVQQYQCHCRRGYYGDGLVCSPAESCDSARNCHPNANCLLDEVRNNYFCACNPGYTGNGYSCFPDTSCNELNTCHPFAQCVFSSDSRRYQCQCNAGYIGDGYQCRADQSISCDVANICSIFSECVYDQISSKYVCRCNEGYGGDGIVCHPIDECNTVENCDPNAQCIYDSSAQRYRCKCNVGYSGSGKSCTLERDVACNVINSCHYNAQCLYDSQEQRYRCQCLPGYEGDGLICEKAIISCNIVNSCSVYAECQYNISQRGYRCRCREGYQGDGYRCELVRSCSEEPQLCDANAECIPAADGTVYVCQCKANYYGDGFTCSVSQHHEGNFLIFTQGMSLLSMPFNPTKNNPGKLLLMEPYQTAVGIDVDCHLGQVFWTDVTHRVIRRAKYNGSNSEIFFDRGLVSPEGIAVDWSSRNVYWTDSAKDTIEVVRIDSLDHKILIRDGLVNPRGITLHPGLGKIYWADWNRDEPKIEVANMDGSDRKIFLRDNLQLPNMLTIDHERNDLCWTDAGLGRIECIGLGGNSRRVIYTPIAYPFGITLASGQVYWTDWEINFIHRVDRNGGTAEPLELPLGGNGKLYDIVTVPSTCPRVRNPCSVQNGGCNKLCLPNGKGGRTCTCAEQDGIESCGDAI